MRKNTLCLLIAGAAFAAAAGCGKEIALVEDSVSIELGNSVEVDLTRLTGMAEEELEGVSADISQVDNMMPGTYQAYVVYEENQYPFTVEVADTTAPEAEILDNVVALAGMPYNARDMITGITELTGVVTASFRDNNLGTESGEATEVDTPTQEFLTGEVTCNNTAFVYDNIGEYDNVLIVTDAAGNQVECPFRVRVCKQPVLSGVEDVTVTANGGIDYMEGVTAVDCYGNDITANITCNSSGVNIQQPGTYSITYYVTDANGVMAEQTAAAQVIEERKPSVSASNTSGGAQSGGSMEGWVPYSNGDLADLVRLIAKGYVVSYGGQYWASPEFARMLQNEETVYFNDISGSPEGTTDRYGAVDIQIPWDDQGSTAADLDGVVH